MKSKNIILIDPFWNGHHPTYIKLLSKILLEAGHNVVTLSPEPDLVKSWMSLNCSGQFLPHFNSLQSIAAKTINLPLPRLQTAVETISLWLAAKQSIQIVIKELGITPDLVFLAWLDSYLGRNLVSPIIDWIFPYPWTGLYFAPRHLRRGQSYPLLRHSFLDPCAILHSSNCTSVAVLDEGIAKQIEQQIRKPTIVFPDFTDAETSPKLDSAILPAILEQARGRKIIGLLGVLAKRKGVLTLIEIAQRSIDRNHFFIFIGQLDRISFSEQELLRLTSFIASNPDNCYFHLERVASEAEFNAAIEICNILFAAYDEFPHSSNLLTKAAIYKKPIIVNEEGCMGERVRNYRLGATVSDRDIEQHLQAIDYLLDRHNSFTELQPKFDEYRELHSIFNLRRQLAELVNTLDIHQRDFFIK
jgi:glycosyltransferase involved in cell wall biosynthesis